MSPEPQPPAPAEDADGLLVPALAITALSRLVVLILGLGPAWNTGWMGHLVQDIRTWHEFFDAARHGLVPYVDFSKEYPIGAGLFYWLMSPFVRPDVLEQTVKVHALFMAAFDVLNTWLFYREARELAPRRAFLLTLLFSLNLTVLVLGPVRFESVVVSFVLVGYRLHRRGRPLLAVLAWSYASWLKWFPAFFIAAQEWRALVSGQRWRWMKAGLVFLGVAAAINLPFALAGLVRHHSLEVFLQPYRFHLERPLYWDTLLGVGQIWLGPLPWERYASWWTLGLVVLALAVQPRMRLEDKGVLMCLAALVFNRIYSTQFHLWFYPLLLLGMAGLERRGFRTRLALFLALDLVDVSVFPFSFAWMLEEISGFSPYAARGNGGFWTVFFSAAIVLRALLLVALAAVLLRASAHGQPGEAPLRSGVPDVPTEVE